MYRTTVYVDGDCEAITSDVVVDAARLTTCDANSPCNAGFICTSGCCIVDGPCENDVDCGPACCDFAQRHACEAAVQLRNVTSGVTLTRTLNDGDDNFFYACPATCDEAGNCGNFGIDAVNDRAFKFSLNAPKTVTVSVTQLDAYIFIVNEMDDNNAMCSDESTVVACGPTVQDVALGR